MRSVLISIQPKWCELIANGSKTIEVRKTKPKLDTPFKVYIYCTKSKKHFLQSRSNMFFYCEDKDFIGGHGAGAYQRLNGKVIGEFVCNCISVTTWCSNVTPSSLKEFYNEETCLTDKEVWEYTKGKSFYEWHISNLVIYDKPKELSELYRWCYSGCDNCDNQCWKHSAGDKELICIVENKKPITRPPQSWCYVESLGNAQ